ncbi:DCC1-like thiol-disulfide oxidoreductase family protein, partial [Francisella tularensis]
MIIVFYDGKCGLCTKEKNHYKKIAPKNIFRWIDITEIDQSV